MTTAKSTKERVEQYFLSHPSESHSVESLTKILGQQYEPQIRKAIPELRKKQGILRPVLIKDTWKDGFFRLNPDYKTLDQIREEAQKAGEQRVFQSEEEFDPKRPAIAAGESPTLPYRRLHFQSILDRMSKSPAFSPADVEMLRSEAPHLVEVKKTDIP